MVCSRGDGEAHGRAWMENEMLHSCYCYIRYIVIVVVVVHTCNLIVEANSIIDHIAVSEKTPHATWLLVYYGVGIWAISHSMFIICIDLISFAFSVRFCVRLRQQVLRTNSSKFIVTICFMSFLHLFTFFFFDRICMEIVMWLMRDGCPGKWCVQRSNCRRPVNKRFVQWPLDFHDILKLNTAVTRGGRLRKPLSKCIKIA